MGVLAVILALCAGVHAAEMRVEVATGVGAAWLVPEGKWDGGVVLLLHGFADDMDGPADVCKHLAEALTAQGIATLRINFRGEGDKKRTDIASTRVTRLEDAAAGFF
jgi:alpha-beta hydrolase superfamily lysophospholipase